MKFYVETFGCKVNKYESVKDAYEKYRVAFFNDKYYLLNNVYRQMCLALNAINVGESVLNYIENIFETLFNIELDRDDATSEQIEQAKAELSKYCTLTTLLDDDNTISL